MAEELKLFDVVWVNEKNVMGKPLKHEWKGQIIGFSTKGDRAQVEDLVDDSQVFWRFVENLEKVKP